MGTRYHYIRNFMTDRPLMNWGHREMISLYYYPNMTSFLEIRRLAEEGKLTPAQAAPYGPRVPEELYDLQNDPDEVVNLADDPARRETLATMSAALDGWIKDTDDKGQYPRSQAAMDEIINRYPVSWLRLKGSEGIFFNPSDPSWFIWPASNPSDCCLAARGSTSSRAVSAIFLPAC